MTSSFPFYSIETRAHGPSLYHTHPRCRIAQSIALDARLPGTGEGRRECPFCFLLGEFQANRALRGRSFMGVGQIPAGQRVALALRNGRQQ
jgi:hypothetical protein